MKKSNLVVSALALPALSANRRLTALVGAMLLSAWPAFAELDPATLQTALDASRAKTPSSGAAAAFVRQGKVLWQGQSGVIAPGSSLPVTPDTLFIYGSASKMVTAAMTMRLSEQGLLGLDQTIAQYLPAGVPGASAVTVRQLLQQTSSFPDLYSNNDLVAQLKDATRPWNRADLIKFIEAPTGTPGAQHAYSNSNYILLGEVIEKASGKTFAQVYQDEIATPLGLTHAFVTPQPREAFAQSVDYQFGDPINYFDLTPGVPTSLYGPAFPDGPVAGTAADGARFLDALARGKVLGPEALKQMLNFDPVSGYGFGIYGEFINGKLQLDHAGGWAGYSSQLYYDEDLDLTIMTLANSKDYYDSFSGGGSIFSDLAAFATDPQGRYIITKGLSNFFYNQYYEVKGATRTIGPINALGALVFTNSYPLEIQNDGELVLTSGTIAVLNGRSTVSGGLILTPENFMKTGSGELDLQSDLIANGTAEVNQGLLSVNGNLGANNLVVNVGGTLGGSGVVFSNVNVLGNLAPGNSPGTLTVSGNLVLAGASSTTIEIASPTNFDRIVVGGQATLGGALNIEAYGGNTFAYGQQYNFLQAGSITGNFASITAPETFRGRFLNSGTVGTILIAPDTYTRVAINPNQVSLAKALDRFIPATSGDELLISTTLDLQTAEQFPAAFDQIMPGFYESLSNLAIEQAFAQTQMLNQRISSVRLGAAGFQAIGGISQPLVHDKNGKSAADAKDASPIVESATATNWNSWALGTGTFSRTTNLGSVDNYNNDAGGFLVGADYRWSENFVTGLYGGYDYSYAEYNGGGSTKGNSFSFGTYASYAKDGYYADAVIGGGYTGFQTQRSIEFSTIDRTASADPNSGQFTAGLNLGKDFEVGKFTLGPIVGAQYTYAGIGSFTESGAESLDLSLGQQNANSLRSTLGGRIAYTWNVNQKIALIPEVRMFWQHEFLNNARNINASLDGGNGAAFDFETGDPYRDSVFAGAGITAQFGERWNASLFYNVNFGSQTYQSNMVSAGLNFSF